MQILISQEMILRSDLSAVISHHLRVSKRGRFLLGMMTNCYSFLSLILILGLSIYYLEFDGMFGMILYYSYIYILDFPQDIIKTFTHSEWPI